MGGFANFALSFSIISILTGAVTLYGDGLRGGGPLVMSVGWPLVTLLTLPIAASLAQLASSFPTAGALYHWSAMLGGPGWGFATAWLNTMGQVAITAGIDFGLAKFVVPMLGLPETQGVLMAVYAVILVSHAVLNHVGVHVVAALNWISAWYHLAGVALMVVALAIVAPWQPARFLLTAVSSGEHPSLFGHFYAYGFAEGLLQAGFTFTGYDASAHVTEETVDPTRNAPWGIFLSVAVSGVAGFALVVAVTLAIGDLAAAQAAPNPFIYVLRTALGERLGSALVWLAMGAMWFCGLASVTSNSRMLFAFARDGGVPGGAYLARVSPRWRSPHVAVWVSVLAAFAVTLPVDRVGAIAALATIALYASYALPIFLGLRARRAGRWIKFGPWDLGRWSTAANVVALGWIAVAFVLFILPPNLLAAYLLAGGLALLAVYWFAWMRGRFRGPKVALDAVEHQERAAD